MMMFRALLAALLFANIHWIAAQDDEEGIESTSSPDVTEDMASTDSGEMSSTEMESTEDDLTSSTDYGSDSGSDSDDDDEEDSEGDGSSSSSDISSTDSGSDDSDDDEESSVEVDSSDDDEGDLTPADVGDEDTEESAEDDNDSDDDMTSASDDSDGEVSESEEDDQDTDESTEGPEDGDEETEDEVDVAGDDDLCEGLDADECGNTFGDDGAQICGYNTLNGDCYEVVMTAGTRGKGNFDDGYSAAQAEADEQASQLYTAIGVLGGIMALLVLTVLGGVYYIHTSRKNADFQHTPVPSAIIDVDGGSNRGRAQHSRIESHSHHYSTDSTPMLDTM